MFVYQNTRFVVFFVPPTIVEMQVVFMFFFKTSFLYMYKSFSEIFVWNWGWLWHWKISASGIARLVLGNSSQVTLKSWEYFVVHIALT